MKKGSTGRILTRILWIGSPALLLAAQSLIFGRNAFAGRPVWSDELGNWWEVCSFAGRGFLTGYNGIQELLPKLGRFSTHGFFPALFYFPFAKLFGWGENGVVIANLVFLSLCFAAVVLLVRPTPKQALLLSGLYLFFTPIALYAASSMTELLNYGLLALFFSCWYRCGRAKTRKEKTRFLLLQLLIGCAASFYRIIYVLLLLFTLFAACGFRFSRKLLRLLPVWILLSGALYFVNSLFTAPYPDGVLYNVLHAGSVTGGARLLVRNFLTNLKKFAVFETSSVPESLEHVFYLLALLFYLLLASVRCRREPMDEGVSIAPGEFYGAQFALLLLPLAIVLVLYDVNGYRDFRTLAPFLWASLFNMALFRRKAAGKALIPAVALLFLINIFFWPSGFCLQESKRFDSLPAAGTALITETVRYDDTAKDPFDNTLAVEKADFRLFKALNPGIGVEYADPSLPLKSKYLLVTSDTEVSGYTRIGETALGTLYVRQ